MTPPREHPKDVSVRQFVADSGSVTRGLRQGRSYTLTLNGEPDLDEAVSQDLHDPYEGTGR